MRMDFKATSKFALVDTWDAGWQNAQAITDANAVRALLNSLLGDPYQAQSLRQLAQQHDGGINSTVRSEKEVLEILSREMLAGRLRILRGAAVTENLMPSRRKPESQSGSGAPAQRKPPPPAPAEKPPDEPVDQETQAECMVEAAEEGAPLLEECPNEDQSDESESTSGATA